MNGLGKQIIGNQAGSFCQTFEVELCNKCTGKFMIRTFRLESWLISVSRPRTVAAVQQAQLNKNFVGLQIFEHRIALGYLDTNTSKLYNEHSHLFSI